MKLVFIIGSGEEMEFIRMIMSSGFSEYCINNKIVVWDVYNSMMKIFGIFVKV